jgi:putative phosphoesterase
MFLIYCIVVELKSVLILIVIILLGAMGGMYMLDFKQSLSGELVREVEGDSETTVIGVISDTHIPTRARSVPPEVLKIFENASYIIHAGDFVQLSVVEELESTAPVVGVQGNMDSAAVREKYPRVNTLEVFAWKIGVVHDGIPVLRGGTLKELAKREGFDVLVFGHSHRGSVKEDDGVLYVNPGSPTQPLFSKASVGVLKVSKKKIEADIFILGRR